MAGKKFSIGDYIGTSAGVSELNTGREELRYLPLDQIDPDPCNFYSLDGLDELAANIELIGLQQPLRVRPAGTVGADPQISPKEGGPMRASAPTEDEDDGGPMRASAPTGKTPRYVVVSGHRRRAACLLIRDGGNSMFDKGVPCIVERGDLSKEMQELRLIYANASTRVMTSAELSKQAERVTELLYRLKEQGVEFPGRMRDHVAQACRMSSAKLARLHAIRERLVPELLAEFDAGRVNESVAYRLSQELPGIQDSLAVKLGPAIREITAADANAVINQVKTRLFSEDADEDGETDCHTSAAEQPSLECRTLPARQDVRNDEERDDEDEDGGPMKASAPTEDEDDDGPMRASAPTEDEDEGPDYREMFLKTSDRFFPVLEGVCSRNDGINLLRQKFGRSHLGWAESGVYAQCDHAGLCLQTRVAINSFRGSKRTWESVYDLLCTIAINNVQDKDGGRQIAAPTEKATVDAVGADSIRPQWQTGTPARAGRYLCRLDLGLNKPVEQRCNFKDGAWTAYGRPVSDVGEVVDWWPLPEEG